MNADRISPAVTYNGASRAQKVSKWFNTAAYTTNAVGTFGNSGRNSLVGPGLENVDFGFTKALPSLKVVHPLFRAEAFNLLNHTNLANPNSSLSSSTFGKITSVNANGSPRVLQVAFRLEF
ncbi:MULTISPECIES: hypothetical protein [Acidobacteriaceae]|uniref:hypothetical protein n=1 Tax=Acidobacteriaceae TaxID=204434 RepID=UPI00131CCE11|nr:MULTISPECIES: hypothetical protein [Acidobacteriaceae]MDW5264660.1 hypothetical protein [Edaphobacter sp.]